jgi:hypothetical protein
MPSIDRPPGISVSPIADMDAHQTVVTPTRRLSHQTQRAWGRCFFLPLSSPLPRFTAGASAFFILSQSGERPER